MSSDDALFSLPPAVTTPRTGAEIVVACDGSALKNPSGPGGWAWYVSDQLWSAGGNPKASNNQMELAALHQYLVATRGKVPADYPTRIILDSTYVRDCVTKWHRGWARNGWVNSKKQPVKNRELIEPIVGLLSERRNLRIEWVRGHNGHPLNEAADVRARDASYAVQRGNPVNTGPGWIARIKPRTPPLSFS